MNEHYEAVLADLEQMKADAEDGIRAIKRLMARSGETSQKVSRPATPKDNEENESIPTLVLQFLAAQPGRSFRFEEIAAGINTSNPKTLRGALSRLAAKGRIGKHGRGRYRAARSKSLNETEEATAA